MSLRSRLLLLAVAFGFAACDSTSTDSLAPVAGVYVASQGNFFSNDGSVVVYDTETKTTTPLLENAYYQSATILGDHLVAASDSRLDVVDLSTGGRLASIATLNPRYLAQTASGKIYVTNLYADAGTYFDGKLTPIDLASHTAGTPIEIGGNPEGVLAVGETVYVANFDYGGAETVTVVNAATNSVTGTLDLGCAGPRLLFVDAQDELVAVCVSQTLYDENYNVIGQTDGAVVFVNRSTGSVTSTIPLAAPAGADGSGQDAVYVDERQELWVAGGTRLFRIDTDANALAETLTLTGATISAVAYDAAADRLYLGRPDATNPYQAVGTVTIHDRAGAQLDAFDAGVFPTHITFRRAD